MRIFLVWGERDVKRAVWVPLLWLCRKVVQNSRTAGAYPPNYLAILQYTYQNVREYSRKGHEISPQTSGIKVTAVRVFFLSPYLSSAPGRWEKVRYFEPRFQTIASSCLTPATTSTGHEDTSICFFKNFPSPVILGEIQYVPELLPTLKRRLDEETKPSRYLMTGSQQFSVR